jgi:anti-sigma factor ChrR (cupin superfamily)
MKRPLHEEVELRAALNALGTVTLNESRAFAEEFAALDEARKAELTEYDEVANLLAFGAPDAEPPAAVWDKLCAVMDGEPKQPSAKSAAAELAAETVQQFARSPLLTVRKEEGEWLELSQGIFVKPLFQNQDQGTSTYMVKMVPGARFELHRHRGVEECMMIEGDFHVDGKVLGPGDYHCAPPGSVHERPYTVGGNLFLVVSSALYESLEEKVS